MKNDSEAPDVSSYPELKKWLDRIGARREEQTSDRAHSVEIWMMPNNNIFVIVIYSHQNGWDIFTCDGSDKNSDSLAHASERLGIEP